MEKEFKESYTFSGKVDRKGGKIFGVALLGSISQNGRDYSKALESLVPLAQNAKCFDGHDNRSVGALLGSFSNIRLSNEKVLGDFELLESCSIRNLILEICESKPHLAGFSICARGKFEEDKNEAGLEVCSEIISLRSVDFVGEPACNSSVYEEINKDREGKMSLENARRILAGKLPIDFEKLEQARTVLAQRD